MKKNQRNEAAINLVHFSSKNNISPSKDNSISTISNLNNIQHNSTTNQESSKVNQLNIAWGKL